MRASDGSHYVAFSVGSTPVSPLVPAPLLVYVRLASLAPPGTTTLAERSVVREWLGGSRIDPRHLPRRGFAVGDMPVMGTAGSLGRRSELAAGSTDLTMLSMQRERDQQRRTELESQAMGLREMLPFEDFDLAASATTGDGTPVISRALTAGPGAYDLFVAWADVSAAAPASTIRVLRRSLVLPPATSSEFALSSVIMADNVQGRDIPYPPAEQSAHPYTIGATEITPAHDAVFSRDERLAVAFQVINAQPSDTGKPDVGVAFRIVRVDGDRELPVASARTRSMPWCWRQWCRASRRPSTTSRRRECCSTGWPPMRHCGRICGWEKKSEVPSESVFSRAFAECAATQWPQRVHEALIRKTHHDRWVGHLSRDATAIEAREKPAEQEQPPEPPKRRPGRPKKGEERPKAPTRLDRLPAAHRRG